mmetsp:Transcript_24055/g.66828  ORF Transcript_24055/g.66828 Transcript_24055/m.66828 type:complete len:278 (+) Transcript_24055:1639-2472(+)
MHGAIQADAALWLLLRAGWPHVHAVPGAAGGLQHQPEKGPDHGLLGFLVTQALTDRQAKARGVGPSRPLPRGFGLQYLLSVAETAALQPPDLEHAHPCAIVLDQLPVDRVQVRYHLKIVIEAEKGVLLEEAVQEDGRGPAEGCAGSGSVREQFLLALAPLVARGVRCVGHVAAVMGLVAVGEGVVQHIGVAVAPDVPLERVDVPPADGVDHHISDQYQRRLKRVEVWLLAAAANIIRMILLGSLIAIFRDSVKALCLHRQETPPHPLCLIGPLDDVS